MMHEPIIEILIAFDGNEMLSTVRKSRQSSAIRRRRKRHWTVKKSRGERDGNNMAIDLAVCNTAATSNSAEPH